MKVIEDFPISKAMLRTTFGNGETWDIPVLTIAKARAAHYAEEYGDIISSLVKDTLPLFEGEHWEITEWALNNMYWSEIRDDAVYRGKQTGEADREMEWCHSELTTHRVILEPEEFTRGETGAFFPIRRIFIYNPGYEPRKIPPGILTIDGDIICNPVEQGEKAESYLEEIRGRFEHLFDGVCYGTPVVIFEGESVSW